MTRNNTQVKRHSFSDKKKIILDEAIALFSVNGYQGTSVSDLANRLGVTKPFIYSYFPNKHALLEEIYEIIREIFFDGINSVLAVERDPFNQLKELIRTYAFINLSNIEMSSILINEEKDLSKRYRDKSNSDYDEFARILSSILAIGAKDGIFDVDDPLISAQIVAGMVRWSHRWYDPTSMHDPSRMADVMTDHILRSVMPRQFSHDI